MGRQIDQNYVKTGKVQVVFKNRAVLGQESVWAAEAALCASDQNRFWDYHDTLFENWGGENQGVLSRPNLKKFAAEIGLDTDSFNSCLDTDKYAKQVQDEKAESDSLGVKATPTFYVNNTQIVGAQPYDVFQKAIEAELR